MSIISQKNENEVAILNCVQRFFSSYKVGGLLKQCNAPRKKASPLFRSSDINSVTFLQEEACICSREPDLSKKDFQRTLFIVS